MKSILLSFLVIGFSTAAMADKVSTVIDTGYIPGHGQHQIYLEGTTDAATYYQDLNACSLNEFGEREICTAIAVQSKKTKLVYSKKLKSHHGQVGTLYTLDGISNIQIMFLDNRKAARVLLFDEKGNRIGTFPAEIRTEIQAPIE